MCFLKICLKCCKLVDLFFIFHHLPGRRPPPPLFSFAVLLFHLKFVLRLLLIPLFRLPSLLASSPPACTPLLVFILSSIPSNTSPLSSSSFCFSFYSRCCSNVLAFYLLSFLFFFSFVYFLFFLTKLNNFLHECSSSRMSTLSFSFIFSICELTSRQRKDTFSKRHAFVVFPMRGKKTTNIKQTTST